MSLEKKPKFVIIDDSKDFTTSIEISLGMQVGSATSFTNEQEALEWAEQTAQQEATPTLILLDNSFHENPNDTDYTFQLGEEVYKAISEKIPHAVFAIISGDLEFYKKMCERENVFVTWCKSASITGNNQDNLASFAQAWFDHIQSRSDEPFSWQPRYD